jgi:predicted acetyltransferase
MDVDSPRLVAPTAALRDPFQEMAREYAAAGDERHARALGDFISYLDGLARQGKARGLPKGHVPMRHFWMVRADRVLGTARLRVRLSTMLRREGGHVGYDIRPSERGKGLGTLLLRLMLREAAALGIEQAFVTCDAVNAASRAVIRHNGGVPAGEAISARSGRVVLHHWIPTGAGAPTR